MKRLKLIPVLLLLCGLVSTNSCTPDDPITPIVERELGPYYMGEFLWYVYFDEGTEWVYEGKNERGKTVYDTVSVTSSTIDTVRQTDGEPNHWKVTSLLFNYSMSSSFFRTEIYHTLPSAGILNVVDTSNYQRQPIKRLVWSEGEIIAFYYDREGLKSFNGTTFEGLQNGIVAGGKTYDNVAVFYVESDPSWDYWNAWPARYYWAKNVGIVKRAFYDGEKNETRTWELVSYKVNQ